MLLALGISAGRHADPDMFHELALAREIVATGTVPREDTFAYTPTVKPCVHHEWGTGLVLHAAKAAGGESGVLLVGWGLAALIAGLALLAARRSGTSAPLLLALAPIAIFLSWIGFSFVRAQMFSLAFLGVLLLCLQADRNGKKRWVLLWPFAHVVWLNLHAGFVVGVLLLGVHALESAVKQRQVRHLVALLMVELVLVAANPWGLDYFAYLSRALTMARPAISEWAPVTSAFAPILGMWCFAVLLVTYALLRRGWRALDGLGIVIAAAAASFLHQRHLSIFALAWFVHVPGWLEDTPLGRIVREGWQRRSRVALAAATMLLCGTSIALARTWSWRIEIPANLGEHRLLVYPAGAVDHLERTGFAGNLFVPFTVGAYVSFRLAPRVRVSIDSRYEVAYPDGSLERVHRIQAVEGFWERELEALGTDAVLAVAQGPLASALGTRQGWRLGYADDAYALFLRGDTPMPFADRRGERIVASFPR